MTTNQTLGEGHRVILDQDQWSCGVGSVSSAALVLRRSRSRRGVAEHEDAPDDGERERRAATNTMRLITISVVLTDGEMPSAVCIRPCTIHGWRPFSVSIHPAVLHDERHGTAQIATHRNRAGGRQLLAPASATAPTAPSRRAPGCRQVRHHPHRPVLDEDVRHVVARAVLLLVLRLELVEAVTWPSQVPVASSDSRCGISMILVGVWSLLSAADLEERERARLAGRPTAPRPRRSSSAGTSSSTHAELAADDQSCDQPITGGRTISASCADSAEDGGGGASRRRCQADTASITTQPVTSDGEQHVRCSPRGRPGW